MNRIELLASLAKNVNVLCDVGCDHAYSLAMAIKKYNVSFGIASDIAEGPLLNAKKTISLNHLEDKTKIVLSNGFENITDNFDAAIISGMGGILICEILSKSLEKIKNKKLIIEANCDAYLVRKFLTSNNYIIIYEESMFDQGKYYEVMVFETGQKIYDNYDILYGPILRKKRNEAFTKYYESKMKLLEEVILKITNSTKKDEKINLYNEIKFILEGKEMQKFYIDNTNNFYRTYFIDNNTRPTIIITPGGGYKYTSPRESEPVVIEFNKRGYHVIVINYRETKEESYPLPGKYIASAMNEVMKDSRVGKTIGLGFSAGGHAILELMLHRDDYKLGKAVDLLMLGYPVITSDPKHAHLGSFENLLLENKNDMKLRNYLSLETQVTHDNAIDLFLWGTFTDESVPVMNSLLLLQAYNQVGANVEYHMFPFGPHAMSVCNEMSSDGNKTKESPYIARWIDMADEWIKLKIR